MKKFFIFLSHPIHYHTSVYKILAQSKDIDLTVYFYSNFGLGKHFDPQFKTEIDFQKEDILEGYKYVFLKNLSKVRNFKFFDFINYEIPKIIWREKPDYVLVNSWAYFSDWLVVLACLFSKTKLCLRSENPLRHEFKKPKWKIFIKKIILGFLFKRVNLFFYIGEENKKFLKFYGVDENKMIFTPYAVDNDYFQKEYEKLKNKREELRKELNIPNDAIVILFVGKLIPKKRPLDLLKAYENVIRNIRIKESNLFVNSDKFVSHSDYSIHLIFVGEGPLREELENYSKKIYTNYNNNSDSFVNSDKFVYSDYSNNSDKFGLNSDYGIHFAGFVSQKEISKYYTLADIFVLPSDIGETWGLVVNEAMNFGLPIIISDMVGCGPDLVKHGENGFIFKTGDINVLSKYLLKLILSKNDLINYGLKSKEIIKEYSYQKSAENILKAIN